VKGSAQQLNRVYAKAFYKVILEGYRTVVLTVDGIAPPPCGDFEGKGGE